MLPWKTMIPIDRSHERAIYLQIAEGLIQAIGQGQLTASQRLPGTRKLANYLGINRKTAEVAYEELMAQGWVEIRPSRGVFVSNRLPVTTFQPIVEDTMPPGQQTVPSFESSYSPVIPPYQSPPPHRIFLGEGSPDVRLAPMERLIKNYRTLMRGYSGPKLMSYGDVQGVPRSRQILSTYLQQTRGLNCQPEQILFTRGSQMGIYLFFRTFIRPGDRVLVSALNYDVADWTIESMGGTLVRAPVDEEGINVEEIEKICRETPIRAAYITPHHHFPTTVTLSTQRRLQLLSLARKHHFYVLEDDYDYDFHYERAPILPLASIDRFERVVYLGSFSKLLAPAVRVGYLVASPETTIEFGKLRRIIDRQGDPLLESAVCQMIEDGDLQRHLKKVIRIYQYRRDYFCQLLKEKLEGHIAFVKPEGGMAVWMQVKRSIDAKRFLSYCQHRGLHLDIDRHLLQDHQGMRLGFASLNEKEMEDALDVLRSFFDHGDDIATA